jgi:hypothetical protein
MSKLKQYERWMNYGGIPSPAEVLEELNEIVAMAEAPVREGEENAVKKMHGIRDTVQRPIGFQEQMVYDMKHYRMILLIFAAFEDESHRKYPLMTKS